MPDRIEALTAWSVAPAAFDCLAALSPDFAVVHIDSGAGRSISGTQALFSDITFVPDGPSVRFGDGVVQKATGIGRIVLRSEWLDAPITLEQCLYIPDCPVNLLSVNATAKNLDCVINFTARTCHAFIGSRTLWNVPATPLGVYQFTVEVPEYPSLTSLIDLDVSSPPMSRIELWHRRFGHPGYPAMTELIKGTLVNGMPIIPQIQLDKFKEHPCDACARGKAKRTPFPVRRRNTSAPLQVVHCDLMGPFCCGLRGEFFALVLTDDFSNWQAVHPIVSKDLSARFIVDTLKAYLDGFVSRDGPWDFSV